MIEYSGKWESSKDYNGKQQQKEKKCDAHRTFDAVPALEQLLPRIIIVVIIIIIIATNQIMIRRKAHRLSIVSENRE